jgi:Domain of unknown function (DUF4845)
MKLPLWRLLLALLVLGSMAAILIMLMPVYFENYQLGQYVRQLARNPGAPDENLRAAIVTRAHQLDLPVQPDDVQITRSGGKLQVHTKYAVQIDFPLYQVDLHLGTNAASR